jgi:hypothetical protein
MILEKIDIIDTLVYCYDEQFKLIKTLELSQFQNLDFSYLDGSKLFTLNITQPIKRVVKFKEINGLDTHADFTEFPYEDMDDKQRMDFNSFIEQVENL